MEIGFDAKRIYQNTTGLGHYGRTLVSSLIENYPQDRYVLFAPKKTGLFATEGRNVTAVTPQRFPGNRFKSLWRSRLVVDEIKRSGIDIFHGLSHELPIGTEKTGAVPIVTVHDLIFERYPDQYGLFDRIVHRKKIRHACRVSAKVIAISEQTKRDLADLYQIEENKIEVCYQSCAPAFFRPLPPSAIEQKKKEYGLPNQYFLSVGSIIERKDLLTVCRAQARTARRERIPVVVIGNGKAYREKTKRFIAENGLGNDFIFLSDREEIKNRPGFRQSTDFPAIYQGATALVYPSVFEGFGIPVLEAMAGGTPAIVCHASCMPETGGAAALYIPPHDDGQLAKLMQLVSRDGEYRSILREKSLLQAQKFSGTACAAAVMEVYRNALKLY